MREWIVTTPNQTRRKFYTSWNDSSYGEREAPNSMYGQNFGGGCSSYNKDETQTRLAL